MIPQHKERSMTLAAVPQEHELLPQQIDNVPAVREAAGALGSRYDRIRRVLCSNSALPEARRRAKDELVALSREALSLWALI
jgi:hypothetical protein